MWLFKRSRIQTLRYHRNFSSKIKVQTKSNELSSLDIRNIFLDYFIEKHNHKFIRSSPVIPFCDPSVPFVNAGMNQFKNIFLDKATAPCKAAVNSQKCIRAGGKHNDLNVIGTDGYHHTFFEMLGNWSFGDYFKEKACKSAWDLLINSYKIDASRLYITYFGGDSNLGLPPDVECKEIWRSIGVADDRILPFGVRDNFWEMGTTGPSGTCSEIHVDHLPNSNAALRAQFVNAGLPDLTELWNIVFIEYNRKPDGSLEPLREKFIDTGMGFERLVAVLQGKPSNYDTDLFVPIFNAISKESGKNQYTGIYDSADARYDLDYAYRLVADHARMCSICIADGMYPQTNNRLQKILRKTLNVCEQTFQKDNLVQKAIIPQIVETLSPVYPELERNFKNICETFAYEDELYKASIESNKKTFKLLKISPTSDLKEEDVVDFPGFSIAYRDIDKLLKSDKAMDSLSTEYLFDKLHMSLGLNDELIQKIATEKGVRVAMDEFALYKKMKKLQAKSKYQIEGNKVFEKLITNRISETVCHQKYDYEFESKSRQFVVQPLKAKVVLATNDVVLATNDENQSLHHIILDRTNFYHTAGGQDSDSGQIVSSNGKSIFNVENVEIHKGFVIHSGHFMNGAKPFLVNDEVNLIVDAEHRTLLSQHHTAMHLLQAAMKKVTNQIVYQQSSHVSASHLKCELGMIGKRINIKQIEEVENMICDLIKAKLPIETHHLAAHELYTLDNLTTVPGTTYPDNEIRVLKVKDNRTDLESIEPCCGTHARNTEQLDDFCFTSFKTGRSCDITAVAGQLVKSVRTQEKKFFENFESFKEKVYREHSVDEWELIEKHANQMKSQLADIQISYITKMLLSSEMEVIDTHIRNTKRAIIRQSVISEMVAVLSKRTQNKESFVIHILKTKYPLEELLLVDAERVCQDLPVIILNICDNKIIQGRASIPVKYISETFNANHWLRNLVDTFKIKCSSAKNKPHLNQSKLKDIPNQTYDPMQLERAIQKTKTLAAKMFDQMVLADENNRQIEADQLMSKLDDIRAQLKKTNSLEELSKINLQLDNIRNDIKVYLYPYEVKTKCMSELNDINNQISVSLHDIETKLFFPGLENAMLEASSRQKPYTFHIIYAEHPLRTIVDMTDLCDLHSAMVLIIITKDEVIGRISIPLKYTNENLTAKHFGDEFITKFDGKCIHHGTRYDTSVTDFHLKKQLVDENTLKEVFETIAVSFDNIFRK